MRVPVRSLALAPVLAMAAQCGSGKPMKFDIYDPQNGPFYDETFASRGVARPGFEPLVNGINALESGSLLSRQASAERALLSMGITFTLYGEGGSTERIFTFDVI